MESRKSNAAHSKNQTIWSRRLLVRLAACLMLAGLMAGVFLVGSTASSLDKRQRVAPNQSARASSRFGSSVAMSTMFRALPQPPPGESITTYDSTCTNPKTSFNLGETVCAQVVGAPLGSTDRRAVRVGWVSPYGSLAQGGVITTDPQNVFYSIPSDATQTFTDSGGGTVVVDNRGTWRVIISSNLDGSRRESASFTVHDPAKAFVDLSINQAVQVAEGQVSAGSSSVFELFVTNNGPDTAQSVVVSDTIPANTTFISMIDHSGLGFTCDTAPTAGVVTCTLASMPAGTTANLTLNYSVNTGTPGGTVLTNLASVSSSATPCAPDATCEIQPDDNSSTASATVTANGGNQTCILNCPDNVNAVANTTEGGQRGAHITFDAADASGACGAVTASPASGSFFAVGTTVVSVSSETGGGSCTFIVSVEDNGTNPPAITCPADQTANADSNCSANVSVGTATATGDNVTIIGTRSDGKPMYTCDVNGTNCVRRSSDDPFPTGVTTITWIAHSHNVAGPYADEDAEIAHRTGAASCRQTVTVVDVTPPTITAAAQTASANASCQAAVPDFSTIATVSDNCACASSDTSQICDSRQDIRVTQDVAPGTLLGLGPHTILLTANDGSSNNGGAGNSTTISVTFTVVDTTPPTFTFVPPPVTAYTGPGATTCDTVVSDATLGTATATDNCGSVTITRTPTGNTFGVGTTTVTWKATDGAGNITTATQTVTVIDNTVPVITVNGTTPSMWPPNHKYQTFQLTGFVTGASDNCGGVGIGNVVIEKVTSDEIENGNGDGNTLNDIVIAADCKSVQLRSEREGDGDGRVYTITFKVTDTHGNVGRATSKVVVAHNPGQTVVDSGVHYTVTGNCP